MNLHYNFSQIGMAGRFRSLYEEDVSNMLILLIQSMSAVASLLLLLGALFTYRIHKTPDFPPGSARGYSVSDTSKDSFSSTESDNSYKGGNMHQDDGTVSSNETRAEL